MTYNFFRIEHGETFAFGTLFNRKDDTSVGVDMAKSVVRIGYIPVQCITYTDKNNSDRQTFRNYIRAMIYPIHVWLLNLLSREAWSRVFIWLQNKIWENQYKRM